MIILGKTTFERKETENKLLKGFDKFEIQMINEFFEDHWDQKIDIDFYSDLDVYAIHAPLTKKSPHLSDLEALCTTQYDNFEKMFKIAQSIAQKQNRKI